MQPAPEKSYQWVFGAPKLPSGPPLPPHPGNQRHFPPKKSDFYHTGLNWTQGQGVNEGKGVAVGWMPHLEGLCCNRRAPAPHACVLRSAARVGFAACKSAANTRHHQLGKAEGKGRLSGRASSMRCDNVPCLEAEERQSSCRHPWRYMGRVRVPPVPPPPPPIIPQDRSEKPASL